MDDQADEVRADSQAAEAVERLRQTIKNIVLAVVLITVLVVGWVVVENSKAKTERNADEYVACVVAGRSDCR